MKNMNVFLRLFIHLFLLRPFVKFFFGINIVGKENIHGLDRYIIIANHNSHLDIILLFSILPVKNILITRPVADKQYFSRSKIVFNLVKFLFDPIWVVRGEIKKDNDILDEFKNNIEDGHNLIIFPEGTRGKPGEIAGFKSGVGRLVSQYQNLPIIPVFLFGPERAFPKKVFFPLPIWNDILVGPPQLYKGAPKDTTRSLERIILAMAQSETANRHKRKINKDTDVFMVAFLGIDGSGKTTVSRATAKLLSEHLSVCLITDTIEFYENNNLKEIQPLYTEKVRELIGNFAKKMKSLKFYKIPKLTELLLRDYLLSEIKKWYKPDFVVMDGSPLINMTAWAILYRDEYFNRDICSKALKILTDKNNQIAKNDPIYSQFPELSVLKSLKLNHLKLPDTIVFLDVDPGIACSRIEKRGEAKQVHEKEDKLEKLRQAYGIVCNVIKNEWNIPTYVINGDDRIENITSQVLALVKK